MRCSSSAIRFACLRRSAMCLAIPRSNRNGATAKKAPTTNPNSPNSSTGHPLFAPWHKVTARAKTGPASFEGIGPLFAGSAHKRRCERLQRRCGPIRSSMCCRGYCRRDSTAPRRSRKGGRGAGGAGGRNENGARGFQGWPRRGGGSALISKGREAVPGAKAGRFMRRPRSAVDRQARLTRNRVDPGVRNCHETRLGPLRHHQTPPIPAKDTNDPLASVNQAGRPTKR